MNRVLGQWGAVRGKAGLTVANSVPGVAVGPTTPVRVGRKPNTGPPVFEG